MARCPKRQGKSERKITDSQPNVAYFCCCTIHWGALLLLAIRAALPLLYFPALAPMATGTDLATSPGNNKESNLSA
ncbi:MAG: hypothetical protein RR224_11115 [Clostridia bacterium]